MKSKAGLTKKDVVVILGCVVFLLANIGAIGSGGRRRAKEAVCLSNLRQWGIIFQTYTNEHDGYLMGGWATTPSQIWYNSLRPYYGEPGKLTCCPEAAKKPTIRKLSGTTFEPWGLIPWRFSGEVGDLYGSYGTNSCIYNWPNTDSDYWKRADVAGADNIPVLLDSLWTTGYPWWTNDPPEYEGQRWYPGGGGCSAMGMFCINRHNGFVNGLFMDFSVRKIGLKQLWRLKWGRRYNINAIDTYPVDWSSGTGWMEDFKDY